MTHLLDRRILFFGGKGGVGKTTCSSALALAASRRGRRVLLVSTDPAHSTSDVFEQAIGPVERQILPGLRALEIDPAEEVRRYVDAAKARLAGVFSPGVVKEAARQIELASTLPGVADTALFDRIGEIVLAPPGDADLVVFDTAPTGHTLRLLRMPDSLGAWVGALARHRAAAQEAARAAGETAAAGRGPGHALLEQLNARAARLARVGDELRRAERVGVVLVLVPERLPIEETARASHLLEECGMAPIGLVVNRVLPGRAEGAYFEARRSQERAYLDEIARRFTACPHTLVPQFESDVHGVAALDRLGHSLLAD